MNKDLDNLENLMEFYQDSFKQIEPYWMKYIEFHRDFIKNIILLSAWIIGFSIPIFWKSDLIKSNLLFLISLIWFILVVILGLVYLKILLSNDNKYIKKTMNFTINTWKWAFDQIALLEKLWVDKEWKNKDILQENLLKWLTNNLNNFNNEITQDLPFQKMYNWLFNTIFVIFIIALVALFLSIINF